jgi:hypothetical protein
VCNSDAPDHRRVAKDDWCACEAVEESNSGAKKNRRDVDVDFVEESSIQALLDGVGAVVRRWSIDPWARGKARAGVTLSPARA